MKRRDLTIKLDATEIDNYLDWLYEPRGVIFRVSRLDLDLGNIDIDLPWVNPWKKKRKSSPVTSPEGSLVGAGVTGRPQARNEASKRNP